MDLHDHEILGKLWLLLILRIEGLAPLGGWKKASCNTIIYVWCIICSYIIDHQWPSKRQWKQYCGAWRVLSIATLLAMAGVIYTTIKLHACTIHQLLHAWFLEMLYNSGWTSKPTSSSVGVVMFMIIWFKLAGAEISQWLWPVRKREWRKRKREWKGKKRRKVGSRRGTERERGRRGGREGKKSGSGEEGIKGKRLG